MKPGARIAVVGISGGQTALACDVAEESAVSLARFGEATRSAIKRFLPGATGENPVDIGATVRREEWQVKEAVEAVLDDDGRRRTSADTRRAVEPQPALTGELRADPVLLQRSRADRGKAGRRDIADL